MAIQKVVRYSGVLVLWVSSCVLHHPQQWKEPDESDPLLARDTDPAFVTSDQNGGWSNGGYYVHNNMWNSSRYSPCTETLYAWSFDNWCVVAHMNNNTGDGAVKTYPNVHKNYDSVPISSFRSIASTFAETSPQVGIYNFTYDIWVNGIATPGCTEIMIWNDNYNQVPGGRYSQDITFGGRAYRVYKRTDSGYIAFVSSDNFTSGTVDLLEMMNWTIGRGWLPANSTLNQICFGVEIVSTDDTEATFQVTDFSIDANLKAPARNAP